MPIHKSLTAALIACTLATAAPAARKDEAKEEARDKVSHTFAKDATLDVDNLNGLIEVIGDDGSSIRLEGERIIRADDRSDLDLAKRDVSLDMNDKGGVAQVRVSGPSHSDHRYSVVYNLTIHVPRATELQLRTVNGSVRASETTGKFALRTVNGRISASDLRGTGAVRTVNGTMTVAFAASPTSACEFETVNGKIDATFPADLKANLHLTTLNGAAFTDFDATVPAGARVIGRRGHSSDLKVGGGGTDLNFKTVNGSITIHKGAGK